MDEGHLERPVRELARTDATLLREDLSIDEALAELRGHDVGERVIYLYVVDDLERLVGVLPVRRLLHAPPGELVGALADRRVVSLPAEATVMEACELLLAHRFLALPVVDAERRVLGVVDATLLTDEVFDLAEREEVSALFETIGLRLSRLRGASPLRAFRLRFPWLVSTIAGGSACAIIAGRFEATLREAVILAFFLTLVLGLAEAVTVQSLSLAVPALRRRPPTWRSYLQALRHEGSTAFLLALACAVAVALLAFAWRGNALASLAIGVGIALSLVAGSTLGLTVPALLHRARLDPTIAAGPVALALADIVTVTSYLAVATWLLASTTP